SRGRSDQILNSNGANDDRRIRRPGQRASGLGEGDGDRDSHRHRRGSELRVGGERKAPSRLRHRARRRALRGDRDPRLDRCRSRRASAWTAGRRVGEQHFLHPRRALGKAARPGQARHSRALEPGVGGVDTRRKRAARGARARAPALRGRESRAWLSGQRGSRWHHGDGHLSSCEVPMNIAKIAAFVVTITSLWLVAFAVAPAVAQEFPKGPVRLIVPFSPGGPTDTIARLMSQKLQALWSQPVVIEYKPGAGTVIGTDAVAKSAPDGRTIGVVVSSYTINPVLHGSMPYDTLKDLSGITRLVNIPLVLVAHPDVPFDDLKGLVAYAKRNPGKLSYASPGAGGTAHLAG